MPESSTVDPIDKTTLTISEEQLDSLRSVIDQINSTYDLLEELKLSQPDGWKAYMYAPNNWFIEGFTADALLSLSQLVEEIVAMREAINGGLTDAEERLLEAVKDA